MSTLNQKPSLEAVETDRISEEQVSAPQSRAVYIAKKGIGFIVDNWLVVGFGLAAVLGYFFPRTLNCRRLI
jgi:hypothetical protein